MEKCSKCLTEDHTFVKYSDLENHYQLCRICNGAFDCSGLWMKEFLKEDFGGFPISEVTKNIINARIKRAKNPGKKWSEYGNPL